MHLAVTGDVEMITDIGKAPCQMTAAKRLHREVTVTARSAAMNYQEGYLPIVLTLIPQHYYKIFFLST